MDFETRLRSEHPDELKLWLRLLTCTQLIERKLGQSLRAQFNTNLARFDLMAQLERTPKGLAMKQLARQLMVTGGNVTGLTDQLQKDGLVTREKLDPDRRSIRVMLTPKGRAEFARMAKAHEDWVVSAFGHWNPTEQRTLYELLGRLKKANSLPESL
ncbi:MAG: hypothetical protein RLZZ502_1343 [Pseudomonadota bacterium]